MPPKKTARKSAGGADLQKHLNVIKKDLKLLSTKISKANRSELSKLSNDASKAVGDTASEIMKSSSELLDKAFKVLHYSYNGAISGGKKALEENQQPGKERQRNPLQKKQLQSRRQERQQQGKVLQEKRQYAEQQPKEPQLERNKA